MAGSGIGAIEIKRLQRGAKASLDFDGGMSAKLSCPDRQVSLQNYGKPTFIQPTAQGQLLGWIGNGRYGGNVVESGRAASDQGKV